MDWQLNTGDTAWVLAASALVLFMTPGLALFYGGLVRTKNVLSTFMHCIFAMGLISIVWFVAGYALGFGPDRGGLVGGGDFYFLDGVLSNEPGPTVNGDVVLSGGIPHMAYMIFQLMFAIITPALIAGAFAERTKFRGVMVFFAAWSLLVYSPVAHWVWGGGWLFDRGVLDFAGGTVVHINAGIAALVFALYVGKRRGWPREIAPPHNVPMVVLGAGILWFGWFGFNGGSALAANEIGVTAFVATHFGAAAAMLGWAIPERLRNGKVTAVGAATGAVAGLVAITPASGFVEPWAACIIGFVAGIACYFACSLKFKFGYDDSLDVVGVHFVGGIVGALLTGVFATVTVNAAGDNGLLFGNPSQLWDQAIGVLATVAFSGIASLVLLFIVDKLVGIRVDEDDELAGLDVSQHGESAYSSGDRAANVGHGARLPVSGGQAPPVIR
ncbi:MAG TPA: ammonium transporter [Actinomycetota bacterium]|nr:ammonium transporter [Actinomycetota bacterium]